MMKPNGNDLKDNQFLIKHDVGVKWIKYGKLEIISRLNLKLKSGLPNYPDYYFIKKNSNRYFKKHLGFTYSGNYNPIKVNNIIYSHMLITINDYKKLMVFRLKYDL
jgi:hypothetical protein